jgi:hypothetical protein
MPAIQIIGVTPELSCHTESPLCCKTTEEATRGPQHTNQTLTPAASLQPAYDDQAGTLAHTDILATQQAIASVQH